MDKATTTSIERISKTCIAVRLRLLNRVVTSFYDDALRPLGLKVSQLNILIVTARLGLARPGAGLRDSATRRVHPQPQCQAVAGPRLAGGCTGRRRSLPALPPNCSGTANDREGDPCLGKGPATDE
jgi:hypothetical protein